jgi:tRNA(Ser,Leu) C12 N-acetylase TAN1
LEKLCFPSVEDVTTCATPFIERHFKDTNGVTFAVEVKKRNSGNIVSMDIINACVAVVGDKNGHKVNLTSPQVVILIEIFKVRRPIISVMRHWRLKFLFDRLSVLVIYFDTFHIT